MANNNNSSSIKTLALMLLITGAIDSIRNLPTTALFGTTLIFFFILSAIFFLIPAALVSAELSSNPDIKSGGIYYWTTLAFGEKIGLLAVWLQWINTMVWFPSILSFIAGTATYLINPELAQNKVYLVTIILSCFWLMTLINMKGLKTSALFANICSLIGMVIPLFLIIVLAIVWIVIGNPSQIHFSANNIFPSFQHTDNWIALTAIMTSFLGMELATVHIKDVYKPQTTFPKALTYSVIFILATMMMGSIAIAIVLPIGEINLVAGIMQAFTNYFSNYHMTWIIPFITTMILIGSVGSMTSWIISPARGLLQAANSGYLPGLLTKTNNYGVASRLLIFQAILVSIICLAFLLMPDVNGSYWLLSALSTQLYMIMYVIMFLAAIRLKYKYPQHKPLFKIPGGKKATAFVSILGLIGSLATIIVGFIPPSSIDVGSDLHYRIVFIGGMLLMIAPISLFYIYKMQNYRKK